VLVWEISGHNRHYQINKAIFELYKWTLHLVLKATINVSIIQKTHCATSVKFIIQKINI